MQTMPGPAADPVVAEAFREIAAALPPLGSPERAEKERAYLKSTLDHLGVPVPQIRRVTAAAVRDLPRARTLALADALWDTGVHEFRSAAVEALAARHRVLDPADLPRVARLLRTAQTWAHVDPLAINVVGRVLAADLSPLDPWTGDPSLWIRRSALLAHLPGIRAGSPDLPRITAYADQAVASPDFFIRKALGWVLRDLARHHPARVAAWLTAHLDAVSTVTFREAVKRLPATTRTTLESVRASPRARRPSPK